MDDKEMQSIAERLVGLGMATAVALHHIAKQTAVDRRELVALLRQCAPDWCEGQPSAEAAFSSLAKYLDLLEGKPPGPPVLRVVRDDDA
jgi:hypothetical protein